MLDIEGIKILESQIEYAPTTLIIIIYVVLGVVGIILFYSALEFESEIAVGFSAVFTVIALFFCIVANLNSPNALNHPVYATYTIEILDSAAWKALGPRIETTKKLYENTEIYKIKVPFSTEENL